jgi:hypothetical protein
LYIVLLDTTESPTSNKLPSLSRETSRRRPLEGDLYYTRLGEGELYYTRLGEGELYYTTTT